MVKHSHGQNTQATLFKGLAASALFVLYSTVALAQPLDIDALKSAAEGGDAAANLTLGEAYLYGTGGAEADPARAAAYLDTATAGGDPAALQFLGEALIWGTHLPRDLERGAALLGEAAAAGDARARRVLGEQLVGGWILDQNMAQGKKLLEAGSEAGDPLAKIALGKFYLHGPLPQNWRKSEALFESAAAAGEAAGLADLGAMIMWRERGWQKAEKMLRRAGDMGESTAWVSLAEGAMYGYLGPKSRRKFDEFAALARAQGEDRIDVLDAQRSIWGISMRASGPKTLETLENAAQAGNREALLFLVALTRNGNQYNIRKDPARAQGYLTEHAALLTPDEREQLAITITAAKANRPAQFKAVVEDVRNMAAPMSPWFANELYAANPNVAFYMLQEREREAGLYRGPLDGFAGPKTVNATYRLCKTLRGASGCADAVFDADMVTRLLMY